MKKISIIVPIYNVEPYLRRCIKSLINQTYKNIEIILVNDGSTDHCGQICDDFQLEDKRIKVIHQKNKGLCGARNAGLKIAQGDYIGFVDSDDWVTPDMFEYLIENLIRYDADIAACHFFRVSKKKFARVKTDGEIKIFNQHQAIENIITTYTLRTFFTNKLFKRELFSNIIFPENFVYEGTHMMHEIFLKCNRVVFLPDAKYYYYKNSDSIVNTNNFNNRLDYLYSCIKRYYDLAELYPEFKPSLILNIMKTSIGFIPVYVRTSKSTITSQKKKFEYVQRFFKNHRAEISGHAKTNFFTKIKLYCYLKNNKFYYIISEILIKLSRLSKRYYKVIIKKPFKFYKRIIRKIFFKRNRHKKPFAINMSEYSKIDNEKMLNLQKKELEILEEFVRICKKHNLVYYLYGGTLLGAVRHKKFIPWDDDIDIVMPRTDYERFKSVQKNELKDKYFYQDCFTDKEYPKMYAKIRLNNTYVREEKWDSKNIHKGIFIDILPLDNFPNNKLKGRYLLKKFRFIDNLCNDNNHPSYNPLVQILFAVFNLLPKKHLYKIRENLLKKTRKFEDSLFYCSFGSHYKPMKMRVLKKSWFLGKPVYLEFEGNNFRVPSNWEKYLIHLFGKNYIKPPKPSDRKNHFNFYEVIFDTTKKG